LGGDGATWTAAVDVFACGMVFFVSLTARLPFDEDKKQPSHVRVAERILFYRKAQALNRAATFAKKLPPAVDAVIAKALAIDPSDRFASAREMLAALNAASDGIPAVDPSVFGTDPDVPYVDEAATSILAPGDDAPTTVTPPSVPSAPMIEPLPVVMIDPTPVGDEGSRPSPPPGSASTPPGSASTPPPASASASSPPVAVAAPEDESPSQPGPSSPPTPAAGAEASTPMGWATEPSEVGELSIRPRRGMLVLAVLGLVALGVAVGTLVVFWPAGSDSPGSVAPRGAAGAPASPTPAPPVTPSSKALDAAVASIAAEGDATAAAADAPAMAKVRLVGLRE